MKKIIWIVAVGIAILMVGCDKVSGVEVQETYEVSADYTAVDVQGAFSVRVTDEVSELTVIADELIMPNVLVRENRGTLCLSLRSFCSSHGTTIQVLLPRGAAIDNISLSGASDFVTPDTLRGSLVKVHLSGASDLNAVVVADDVDVEMSGSSDFYGDVYAFQDADITLSGASQFHGRWEFDADAEVHLSGASTVSVSGFCNSLTMHLTGASNLLSSAVDSHYGFMCVKVSGDMSGASLACLHCSSRIDLDLSGASELHYTGQADTHRCVCTGESAIMHDVL